MRIDCHNDSILLLRNGDGLNNRPDAHFDFVRLRDYLDVAFCAIFVDEQIYPDHAAEEFVRLLDLFEADLATQPDIHPLLYRDQLENDIFTPLVLISMEGASPLGADGAMLEVFFSRGLRAIGLTWNYNNKYAGAAMQGGGLTDCGRRLVERCNRLGVLVDVAHSSSNTLRDVLACSSAPIIDSHTVCGALCSDFPRAISDDELRAIAAGGGVAAITFVPDFLGGSGDVERCCEHIEYAVALIGSEHVGLGGDFDGAVLHHSLAGVQYLPALYRRLQQRGMSDADVKNVCGESVRFLLRQVLPAR